MVKAEPRLGRSGNLRLGFCTTAQIRDQRPRTTRPPELRPEMQIIGTKENNSEDEHEDEDDEEDGAFRGNSNSKFAVCKK